jgi:hypothetical protein
MVAVVADHGGQLVIGQINPCSTKVPGSWPTIAVRAFGINDHRRTIRHGGGGTPTCRSRLASTTSRSPRHGARTRSAPPLTNWRNRISASRCGSEIPATAFARSPNTAPVTSRTEMPCPLPWTLIVFRNDQPLTSRTATWARRPPPSARRKAGAAHACRGTQSSVRREAAGLASGLARRLGARLPGAERTELFHNR